eukprot:jgi/Mesen1/10564/ME000843S10074
MVLSALRQFSFIPKEASSKTGIGTLQMRKKIAELKSRRRREEKMQRRSLLGVVGPTPTSPRAATSASLSAS